MAGSTTSSLSKVYLLSLSYVEPITKPTTDGNISSVFTAFANNATALEIRANYIGLCGKSASIDWICSTNVHNLKTLLVAADILNPNNNETFDPLDLLGLAEKFKSQIVFDGLL